MVEMIAAIVIVGIVFGLGAIVLGRAFESYALTQDAADVDWQGRVALERIARELRELRSAAGTDLAFTGNPMAKLQFVTADGGGVCFYLAGVRLMRSADAPGSPCGTTNPRPLADGVTGFQVRLFKNDGTGLVVPPDSLSQAYYFTVELSVGAGSLAEAYRLSVQPRRL